MRREYSILVMLILCASTFAGCLGDGDLSEIIEDDAGDVVIPEPMTVTEFATFMSEVDDGDLTPFGNITKAGTRMVVCCTLNMDEGSGDGSVENATMTMTSMYDQELQRMMISTTLSITGMGDGGAVETHTMENTRTMGAAPNGSSHEGIVNIVMSEMGDDENPTGDLIKYFAFDWAWDWDVVSAELLSDEEEEEAPMTYHCRTVAGDPTSEEMEILWSQVNDGTVDCGDGSDEPQDFDGDGTTDNWWACITNASISIPWDQVNDGTQDCPEGSDEGIFPDMDEEIALFPEFEIEDGDMENGSWMLLEIVNVTSGEAKFISTIVDEGGENITVTVSVLPTTPPTVTSMVMENETMSMGTYFLFGDDVVIDLVDTEGDGWIRGATDMMIGYDEPCYYTDCSSGEHIDGWMAIDEDDEWLEAPNENLYLHIMGPEPDSPPPTAAEAMGNDTDGNGKISWSEFVYAWNSEEDENMSHEEATEFSMLFNESDMHYWVCTNCNEAGDGELNLSELEIFIEKMEMLFGPPMWHCSSTVGGTPDTEISFELVNDGTEDCGDGSDEPQDFDGDGTTDNWFDCMDDVGTNISMDDVNDGWEDCLNVADEYDDDDGDEGDYVMVANISISALVDVWPDRSDGCDFEAFTDSDGAVWDFCLHDNNDNGLVDHPDTFNMTTDDATNGSFEILLYDADAGDYAGSMMPGFSGLLACITMLGACLFIRRKD